MWGHAMAIGSRLEPSMGGRVMGAFLHTLPLGCVLHTLVHQVNGKKPEVTKVGGWVGVGGGESGGRRG